MSLERVRAVLVMGRGLRRGLGLRCGWDDDRLFSLALLNFDFELQDYFFLKARYL